MRRRRSLVEITAQILIAANGGARRSEILQCTGLSAKNLREYVFLLNQKGLLEYEPLQAKYKTTEKGYHYLDIYEQMNTLVSLGDVIKLEA